MGTEPCGSDLADTTAMGRRTFGFAYKHEATSKEWPDVDRALEGENKLYVR